MIDWRKRKEEIEYWIELGNLNKLSTVIIAQEQTMLAKAEEEKRELIEQLKSNWQMMEKYECKDCDIDCDWFRQRCEIKDTKKLIQKMEEIKL